MQTIVVVKKEREYFPDANEKRKNEKRVLIEYLRIKVSERNSMNVDTSGSAINQ